MSALLGGLGCLIAPAAPPNPCLRPGNLIRNCSFDGFAGHDAGGRQIVLPDGWGPFILSGTPDFRPADDTCPGEGPGCGAPSLWLISEGMPFTAGVYQQVAVTPGVVYQADIGWAAVSAADFERKLGMDPTGGTDPLAPTVVWGRSEWGLDKWPDLTVTAQATGPTMTLFIWVGHPVSHGADSIYLDAPGLWPDPSQPTATATPLPSSTPTRRPKAPASTPHPPTSTQTSPPSPTPTFTPTLPPTATATVAPSATWTATPSPVPPTPTSTPTGTPTSISVAVARAGSTTRAGLTIRAQQTRKAPSSGVLLYVAAGAVAGALVLAGCVAAIWLRGRSPE